MSLWHIAWSYLWNRKLTTFLTVLSVSLGVALISTVLTLEDETRRRFEDEGKVFDIVVGAKGSPLQLVLSSVYFMDTPTGNILYSDYEALKTDPDVAEAYPIGLGDTYRGFRIVGTSRDLFDYSWTDTRGRERRPFQLAEGRYFEGPMEAVVGALAAKHNGLEVGSKIVGTHGFMEGIPSEISGFDHSQLPYTVVGILEPAEAPTDRAIYVDLESVWDLHAHHGEEEEEAHADEEAPEVTAVLVSLHTPALQFQFKDRINREMNVLAVTPIIEISKFYDQFLGTAKTVLVSIGFLVVVISALSIMIGLYLSIVQRRRDLAIMRALGASSSEIFGSILIEAFWVTLLGIGAGWFLGAAVSWSIGTYLTANYGLIIQPFATNSLIVSAFAAVALVGILAGVLPAIQAYRTDVARDLAAV